MSFIGIFFPKLLNALLNGKQTILFEEMNRIFPNFGMNMTFCRNKFHSNQLIIKKIPQIPQISAQIGRFRFEFWKNNVIFECNMKNY